MALVITLIMLSIITVLAVAFLAVTRRERASVTLHVEQTGAKMAAEAAFARAQAEIIARMQASTSILTYDYLVSTNQDGRSNTVAFPINGPVAGPVDTLGIAELTNDARVPVFINTNRTGPLTYDFRWWIDLNRNRTNEPAINGLTTVQAGEPEWLGILENPNLPHSRNNKFLYRIAFMALPATKSLDLNYVHNHAMLSAFSSIPNPEDHFRRNHGFGNWEYNLGAFFADLNTNYWPGYVYNTGTGSGNLGAPFQSAADILAYRYKSLVATLGPFPYAAPFGSDGIDEFSDGPLTIGGAMPTSDIDPNPFAFPTHWPGNQTSNNFIARMDELVDVANVGRYPRFFAVMSNASLSANAYDRATYFRMISQMGCDSDPALDRLVPIGNFNNYSNIVTVTNLDGHDYKLGDWVRVLGTTNDGTYRVTASGPNWFNYYEWYPAANYNPTFNWTASGGAQPYVRVTRNNKINLNYNNQRFSETKCVPWTPEEFFHVVGDRLLRSYTNFGIDGIPVYLSANNGANRYTPRVHQILQIAANIFDAGTNNSVLTPDWPTIYRPVFLSVANGTNYDVFVNGYTTNVSPLFDQIKYPTNAYNPRDVLNFAQRAALTSNDMVFGHPAIVGAKKGWPNFNELTILTSA
ncbi:MAG: hypothetical protein HY301_19950 [Verrucomicrobia bacterium]|nr:hypothetical protein [Verrucomicrobiota bacterium]